MVVHGFKLFRGLVRGVEPISEANSSEVEDEPAAKSTFSSALSSVFSSAFSSAASDGECVAKFGLTLS